MYSEKHIKAVIPQSSPAPVPAVGMIVLSTDFTCERDFRNLAAAHDLQFDLYVNRIHFENPMTVQSLRAMLDDLASVAADILPGYPLDAIVFNCTSASALLGDAAVRNAIQLGKPGIPVLTTAAAGVGHILQAGYKNISLLTPYSLEVSRGLVDYFERGGLNIMSLNYMEIADDRDVAKLTSRAIIDAACAAIDVDVEALFISCTATRASEILPEIEQVTGLPVFSSNHSSFWQAMKILKLA